MKTQQIKILIGILMLAVIAVGSACSSGKAETQKMQSTTAGIKPNETPTPDWKPQKRVSKDIINTETKNEPTKIKTKK